MLLMQKMIQLEKFPHRDSAPRQTDIGMRLQRFDVELLAIPFRVSFTWVRVIGTALLHGSRHLAEQIDDVVQSYQVSVLVVAYFPVFLVSYFNAIWNRSGFCEVNQPATRMLSIVKEQQWTANYLVRLEEFRMFQSRANGFEALHVPWLVARKGFD